MAPRSQIELVKDDDKPSRSLNGAMCEFAYPSESETDGEFEGDEEHHARKVLRAKIKQKAKFELLQEELTKAKNKMSERKKGRVSNNTGVAVITHEDSKEQARRQERRKAVPCRTTRSGPKRPSGAQMVPGPRIPPAYQKHPVLQGNQVLERPVLEHPHPMLKRPASMGSKTRHSGTRNQDIQT
ncbi:hypothetical protein EAE96_002893 [Botrytis aclada]|nr:hypothetical protein EAE96_002893 [Botrytis aclada]